MVEGSSPIVPRANDVVYLEKPPLLYWLAALSMRTFGPNAFAARLPSALAALATALLVVAAGRRLGPCKAGALSGLVFATSMGLIVVARQVLFDSLLTLWITLALLSFWFGTEPDESAGKRQGLLAVGYASLALALLTKGLAGVVLPALVVLVYVLLSRDRARLRSAVSPLGIALFLAIALPWHLAAALTEKRFAWFYLVNEHWLRFLGRRQPPDFHEDPIFSPALSLIVLILPWGFFLPSAMRSELAARRQRRGLPSETIFLLCWAAVPALFFTLSRTRTYYYQLPSVPALALLIGRFWARAIERPRGSTRERGLFLPAVVLAVVIAGAWLFARFGSWGSLRNAAWHALAFACGGWLVAGLAAGAILLAARRELAAFAAIAVGVLLTVAVGIRFAATERLVFRSEQAAARLIESLEPPAGTRVAMEGKFENHSSLAFYLPRRLRPLLVVDALGQGDLGFGSGLEDTRRIFVSTPTMHELTDTDPLFYLTLSPSKLRVPPKLKLVACDDETMLWTNLGDVTGSPVR